MTANTLKNLKLTLLRSRRPPASVEFTAADHIVYDAIRRSVLYILDHSVMTPDGRIPGLYDDIEEYANLESFPEVGQSGKLYADTSTGKLYVWRNGAYKEAAGSDVVQLLSDHVTNTDIHHELVAPSTEASASGKAADAKAVGDALSILAPLNSPAFTGTPTVPDPSLNSSPSQIANLKYVNTLVDTESPLVARSFPVQAQTGWTAGLGNSNQPIYFRPRYFGMADGDLFKGIVLQTRSSGTTPFPEGVYMRLKRYSDGQTLGVSELTVWPSTGSTDVVFRFPQAIPLPSSGNYYTLDFSSTPDGSAVTLGMNLYVTPSDSPNADFYFASSRNVPVATVQFYSWASDLMVKVQSVSWADLKAKRDGGNLVPGQQYRITDYVATTNGDMESQSANHPFDIIVTADDERTLNEHVRATIHEGDLPDDIVDGSTRTKYFAGCDLAAWDLWYCLDNDTNRFAWADSTNGKGVIYRLVDEFQNDCPYDFKGIQFKAYGDTDNVWRYTFDSGDASDNTDFSKSGMEHKAYGNTIRLYSDSNNGKSKLNRIVFKGSNCYSNTFNPNCYINTFRGDCHSNTFGSGCYYNKFGSGCYSNTFDPNCYSNTFSGDCYSNTFGSDCYYNKIGLGCHSNTFGANCYYNEFGSECYYNTFGPNCCYIKLGGRCVINTFGANCYEIIFGTALFTKSFCRYVRVASGNGRLYINPTGTTSASQPYQNVEIKEGVNNPSGSNYKTIDDPNAGQTFLTTYKPANSQEISL